MIVDEEYLLGLQRLGSGGEVSGSEIKKYNHRPGRGVHRGLKVKVEVVMKLILTKQVKVKVKGRESGNKIKKHNHRPGRRVH